MKKNSIKELVDLASGKKTCASYLKEERPWFDAVNEDRIYEEIATNEFRFFTLLVQTYADKHYFSL